MNPQPSADLTTQLVVFVLLCVAFAIVLWMLGDPSNYSPPKRRKGGRIAIALESAPPPVRVDLSEATFHGVGFPEPPTAESVTTTLHEGTAPKPKRVRKPAAKKTSRRKR